MVFLGGFLQKRLLDAMKDCQSNLSGAEVKRNVHGPMYCYEHSTQDSGTLDARFGLSTVKKLTCKETRIYREEVSVGLFTNDATLLF